MASLAKTGRVLAANNNQSESGITGDLQGRQLLSVHRVEGTTARRSTLTFYFRLSSSAMILSRGLEDV